MLKEKLAEVIEKWRRENVKPSPPKSEKKIVECFLAIERSLSKDVLEFYSICDGTIDEKMDNSLLSVWSLETVVKENSTVSKLTYFADFLIESHRYAFKYENENTSSVYSDWETSELIKVADSVERFFDLYLTKPNEIGLFKE